MAFAFGGPNIDQAAGGNEELRQLLLHMTNRLQNVEKKTSTQAIKTGVSPIAKPPQAATAQVTKQSDGVWTLALTNPEFIGASNPQKSPIYHQISWSTEPDFSANVTNLPPSHQTYYPIFVAAPQIYVQYKSSFDGQSYNKKKTVGPF